MHRLTDADYSIDAVTAAKALLGAWLCRRLDDGTVMRRRITETEAYCGEEDTACHAHKGRTPRTDVMYSPGGCAYVEGAEGPGRLTKALCIDRSLNREDLVSSRRLWIESDGARPKFTASPRIGIAYASWRDQRRKWRCSAELNDRGLD